MDWSPFRICESNQKAPAPRAMETLEGIGDRLRAAAFAEKQAIAAFIWAADTFEDAPTDLRQAWRDLAKEEEKHLGWLCNRMNDLNIDVSERPVSSFLWESFKKCDSAEKFALYMAKAEERGRIAGERFREALAKVDPVSSQIFGQIAKEEQAHIDLAKRYFPKLTRDIGLTSSQPQNANTSLE